MMISKKAKTQIASLVPIAQVTTEDADLNDERLVLRQLSLLVHSAEKATALVVADLRREGATWEAIGELLGVTRQAAQQRYGS
jgi:hypothetical protein